MLECKNIHMEQSLGISDIFSQENTLKRAGLITAICALTLGLQDFLTGQLISLIHTLPARVLYLSIVSEVSTQFSARRNRFDIDDWLYSRKYTAKINVEPNTPLAIQNKKFKKYLYIEKRETGREYIVHVDDEGKVLKVVKGHYLPPRKILAEELKNKALFLIKYKTKKSRLVEDKQTGRNYIVQLDDEGQVQKVTHGNFLPVGKTFIDVLKNNVPFSKKLKFRIFDKPDLAEKWAMNKEFFNGVAHAKGDRQNISFFNIFFFANDLFQKTDGFTSK